MVVARETGRRRSMGVEFGSGQRTGSRDLPSKVVLVANNTTHTVRVTFCAVCHNNSKKVVLT